MAAPTPPFRHAVGTRDVQLDRIGPGVLHGTGKFLPFVRIGRRHDTRDKDPVRIVLLNRGNLAGPVRHVSLAEQFDILKTKEPGCPGFPGRKPGRDILDGHRIRDNGLGYGTCPAELKRVTDLFARGGRGTRCKQERVVEPQRTKRGCKGRIRCGHRIFPYHKIAPGFLMVVSIRPG